MKKVRKAWAAALAAALAFAMILPAGAASYDTSYESPHGFFSYNGANYQMWSWLYRDARNEFRGSSWICNMAAQDLPDRALGASSGLYHPDGRTYHQVKMSYNNGPNYFHFQSIPTVNADPDGILCNGVVAVANGPNSYNYYPTPSTQVVYPSDYFPAESIPYSETVAAKLDKLAEDTLDENGEYPVTADGETYGSALLAWAAGHRPDLILAEGMDGVTGYIRADDLRPDVNTPEEALAYMDELARSEERYEDIPLYDLEGNVIGSFRVALPDPSEEIPEEIQAKIEQLNRLRELPRNSRGETYGTIWTARDFGIDWYDLDLAGASGTNGESGYIRTDDLVEKHWRSKIRTRKDAMEYMDYLATLPEITYLPLYDLEGNVIGEFRSYGMSKAEKKSYYEKRGYYQSLEDAEDAVMAGEDRAK